MIGGQEQDRSVAANPRIIKRQPSHPLHSKQGASLSNPAAPFRHDQDVSNFKPEQ